MCHFAHDIKKAADCRVIGVHLFQVATHFKPVMDRCSPKIEIERFRHPFEEFIPLASRSVNLDVGSHERIKILVATLNFRHLAGLNPKEEIDL